MGYYSELAITDDTCHNDHSQISHETQLRLRIEDLWSQLEDVAEGRVGADTFRHMDYSYSKNNLAYVLPEHLFRESDIMVAISIAAEKLAKTEADSNRRNNTKETRTEYLSEQLTCDVFVQTVPSVCAA